MTNTDYVSICKLFILFSILEHTSWVAGPYLTAHCHILSSQHFPSSLKPICSCNQQSINAAIQTTNLAISLNSFLLLPYLLPYPLPSWAMSFGGKLLFSYPFLLFRLIGWMQAKQYPLAEKQNSNKIVQMDEIPSRYPALTAWLTFLLKPFFIIGEGTQKV